MFEAFLAALSVCGALTALMLLIVCVFNEV